MAYFGVIFFANMGGGGGQNYFHLPYVQTSLEKARLYVIPKTHVRHLGHHDSTMIAPTIPVSPNLAN